MPDKLVLFMYQAWMDLSAAVEGLTTEEATTRDHGGSSIAWVVGHVTNMVDSWLNVQFQGLPPDPTISQALFRRGESGDAADWPAIQSGAEEVRQRARVFLEGDLAPDLDLTIPYQGSIQLLHPTGLSLRYAVLRIAGYHFLHAGEIGALRSRLGRPLADDPGWGKIFL